MSSTGDPPENLRAIVAADLHRSGRFDLLSPAVALIVECSACILGLASESDGIEAIAKRSRGTPRIANRLLRRVRDFAQVKADGVIGGIIANDALDLLEVDNFGLDALDRRLLSAIMEKFYGGPVGVESLAAAIGEERGTLEDVVEPFGGGFRGGPLGRFAPSVYGSSP